MRLKSALGILMVFFNWLNKKSDSESRELDITRESDFSNFKKVTDFIYEKSGITDLDKRALTSSRTQQYAIDEGIYTTDEFLSKMNNDHQFYQEIINIVTVNETFFLRELKELEWLVAYIKSSTKHFKILSMPSSSGEEIYSILLLLCEAGVDISRIEISGYDINSDAIAEAQRGEYDGHSLHKIDNQTKHKYFNEVDNYYQVIASLREKPKFEQINIFDLHNEKNKYDIVLSRNMFIYFDNEKREKALSIIVNLLKTDGIYIKGHADHIQKHPNLDSIEYGIYKKV